MTASELSNQEWEIINGIINDLYKNNEDIDKVFLSFLANIRKVVHYDKANIYFFNAHKGVYEIDKFLPFNWEDNNLKNYLDYYYQLDDVLPIISCSSPVLFKCTDFFVMGDRENTDYYKDFIEPAKIHYGIEGNIMVVKNLQDLYVGGIGMFRSKEDFTLKDLYILKLLRPHLSNISSHYQKTTHISSNVLSILDNLHNVGVGFLDENFQLTFTNSELKAMLTTMNTPEFNERIGKVIRLMLETGNSQTLEKIDISGKSFLIKVVHQPAKGDQEYMLVIYSIKEILLGSLQRVREKYGLTIGEYEVLTYSLDGLNNEEIADKLHISLPAVKKRFSGIYQKMGLKGRHQILDML